MSELDRLLITGSSGLIGTHLVTEALGRGLSVCATDIVPPTVSAHRSVLQTADLLDPRTLRRVLREFEPTQVVHLAARTDLLGQTVADYDANITGTKNLIDAIHETPSVQRTVYVSTELVCHLGYQPEHDEDYAPTTVYGESKAQMERIVRSEAGGQWCLARPTTIWGPWIGPHYQRFLRMLRRGIYVHVGSSKRWKSYGYVGNACHQLLGLLDAPASAIQERAFYVADYEPTSLRAWADALARDLGGPRVRTIPPSVARAVAAIGDTLVRGGMRRFPFTSFRLNNVMTESNIDMSPTQEVVPELPYTLEDGVGETARWFLDQERT